MIVTLTPNPSIDATLTVPAFTRGEVNRVTGARREAGGKGINVSHVVHMAGRPTLAIAPCGEADPFELAVGRLGFPLLPVRIPGAVRTNTAITEPDGTTTKINEQGPSLIDAHLTTLTSHLSQQASSASAVVLAGSLPPGAPDDFYVALVRAARAAGCPLVAVDTSDAPLVALGEALEAAAPDVLKPNAFELAQLAGLGVEDGREMEARAEAGDAAPAIAAARGLIERGAREILVTLGGAGACLVTPEGAWVASPPPITVQSTVGAGDSSLAGYIMARIDGLAPAECLRRAVAYGSAAAALPGTGLPTPDHLNLNDTRIY